MANRKNRNVWAVITGAAAAVYMYPLFLFIRGWSMQMRAYGAYGQTIPPAAYVFGAVCLGAPLLGRLAAAVHMFVGGRHAGPLAAVLFCLDVLFVFGINEPNNPLPAAYRAGALLCLAAYYVCLYLFVIRTNAARSP